MGSVRVTPKLQSKNRQALRRAIPVDLTGMGPEEKEVFAGLGKYQNTMTGIGLGPSALPRAKPAPKKKKNWLGF